MSYNPQNNRNYHLDNAKFVLILLVVFWHLSASVIIHSASIEAFYRILGTFRLPAFVFLAGMTSRRHPSRAQLRDLLITLIVFQFIYVSVFETWEILYLIQPYWLLWFVLSLFWWRLILHWFYYLPYPFLISIIIALISGMLPNMGYLLSLSLTLGFLPFFIAGHFFGNQIMNSLATKTLWQKSIIVITGLIAIITVSLTIKDFGWHMPYHLLGVDNVTGLFIRISHLLAAAIGIIMFLAIIPSSKNRWSSRGAKTISVYLLHGFFVIPLRPYLSALSQSNSWLALLVSIILALGLSWLLSTAKIHNLICRIYKWVPEKHSLPKV